jgi:hypothetical protein
MKKTTILAVALAAAVATAGCFGFEHTSTLTQPTSGSVNALMGTWASASVVPSPSSCTDFKWNATEQTSTSARGSFSATCANDLKVTGTAQGTLNGASVNWTASGTTSAPNQAACSFTLAGTAELAADSIRVPYSGTVCQLPVSGVEILKRR